MALICETVLVNTMREMRARRDESRADMVELRLDGVADVDVAGALEGRRKPVLVTCRAAWEGGRFDGGEDARLRILQQALASDADFVDLEWRADRRALAITHPERVVLSHHDFTGLPADVDERAREMRRANPGGTVKVACATNSVADLLRLRAVASGDSGPHVVIGMGSAGLFSRVCPGAFGSRWTYGGNAAPGQVPVTDLSGMYRVRSQTAATRLFGLTGQPIGHSASPAMHNAAFEAARIDAVYVPIETNDAGAFLHVADAFGLEGVSVTAPHKRAWSALGVEADERGQTIGAANTLRRRDGRWSSTNFDVEGFLSPLHERGVVLKDRRCVVLGAGGAARAATWALVREGARVEVSARRADQARTLGSELGVTAGAWPPALGWDLLVNATPAGTAPEVAESPIPRSYVEGGVVYDLVYHPRQTQLLKWAASAGAATIEGLDMLVAQAALQFEYWMGRPAPRDVMRAAAERFLDTGTE